MEVLGQQLDFIAELEKLKAVYRKMLLKSGNNRKENSAEHSWHIAVMASVLQEYAADDIDIARVIKMLLIHDIVEIDAGDTFAFADSDVLKAQREQELKAARRLFGLLPEKQSTAMMGLWIEFEQAETNDARFAKAMDCMLPVLQNMNNQGGSWVQHGISDEQVLARNQYLETAAPGLWNYVCQQVEIAVKNKWLKKT